MRLGDPREHLTLTRSVAHAMGVDLNEAIGAARLEPKEFADMITRCRTCACVAECKAWIAAHSGLAREAPASCPNGPALDALNAR